MNIDWPTLISSVAASTAAVGALAFMLQKSFEKLLESKLRQSEERTKAELTEELRRQAAIHDKRFDALKTILSLIYRARNSAKQLAENLEDISKRHSRDEYAVMEGLSDSIRGIMYDERALIPGGLFRILHEHKHALHHFMGTLEEYRRLIHTRRGSNSSDERRRQVAEDIARSFEQLDNGYVRLTDLIQASLGTDQDAA